MCIWTLKTVLIYPQLLKKLISSDLLEDHAFRHLVVFLSYMATDGGACQFVLI